MSTQESKDKEQPRYINGVNGVYDTVDKRYIYGLPPVKNEPADEPAPEDASNEVTQEAPPASDVHAAALTSGIEDATSSAESETGNQIIIDPNALSDFPVGELPTGYLMAEVEQLLYKIAYVMDCSPDIVLSTMFAVVSGAVGTKVTAFDGKYTNMLNINVCHVAPPGSNKTQPVSLLVKPLENISIRMNAEYKEEKRRCQEMKEVNNMPYPQILYISNPTPEAINKMLSYNPHGLFARRDELAGFIEDLGGRYSNGSGGIPDFLSVFTNEHISIIRASEEPIVIPKPYLTVVGGIQPGILRDVIGKAQMINSGFNYRWLFVAPEIKIALERKMVGIPQGDLDYWEKLIEKYHNISPMTFHFDNGAQLLLNDYFREIRLKKTEGSDVYMDEVRDKLFIYLEKIAAIATLLHGDGVEFFGNQPKELMGDTFANGTPCAPVITAEAVEYAVQCMHVLEGWARKVRDIILSPDEKKPMTLGDAIRTLNNLHPIVNKKQFAESCGMTREQLYKYLPKKNKEYNQPNNQTENHEVTPENSADADIQTN